MTENKPEVKTTSSKGYTNKDKGKEKVDRLNLTSIKEEGKKIEKELQAWRMLEQRFRDWKRSHRYMNLRRKHEI